MASKRRLLGAAQLQQLDENVALPSPAPVSAMKDAATKRNPAAFRALASTLKTNAASKAAPAPVTNVKSSGVLPGTASPAALLKTISPELIRPPIVHANATPKLERASSVLIALAPVSQQEPIVAVPASVPTFVPATAPFAPELVSAPTQRAVNMPVGMGVLRNAKPFIATLAPAPTPALQQTVSASKIALTKKSVEEAAAELSSQAKREYNGLVLAAKAAEKSGDVCGAVQLLERAASIAALPMLVTRLERLRPLAAEACMERNADGWFVAKSDGKAVAYVTSAVAPNGTSAQHLRVAPEHYEKMLPHQREGVAWLWRRQVEGEASIKEEENGDTTVGSTCIGGAVLADDMGLGKTIQVTVFLAALFRARLMRTALLFLPLSVVDNWRSELAKWSPDTPVAVYHGSKSQREVALRTIALGGVCLSTYGMVLTCTEQLAATQWDYVILDEGHKIKNPGIKLSKTLPLIGARHRVVLTGSPLQNSLLELWALFDYACAGRLLGGRASFVRRWEAPISVAHDRAATRAQLEDGNRLAAELRSLIAPYFLRREKRDVFPESHADSDAPMPALSLRVRKNDFIVWLPPSKVQLDVYRAFLSSDDVKATLNRSTSPLAAITVLKKICDHPSLLGDALKELGMPATELNGDGADALVPHSSKLQFLQQLLPELKRGGHRVLLFSQSRRMLDLIQTLVTSLGLRFCRIDGTIAKVSERQRRIDLFNADPSIFAFLLTTGVGGLGINLTSADRVVIFDPAWSPIDNQAVDRVYRIGQKRDVVIYRLITCGTIEEKIYGKQVFKGALFQTVANQPASLASMAVGGGSHRYFTGSELRALFELGATLESPTQQQLHALHSHMRRSDATLDKHTQWLESRCAGISDHNLLYADAAQAPPSEGAPVEFFPSRPGPVSKRRAKEEEEKEKETSEGRRKGHWPRNEEDAVCDEEEHKATDDEKEGESEDDVETDSDEEQEGDISGVVHDAEDLGAANLSHLYNEAAEFSSNAPASRLNSSDVSAYNDLVARTDGVSMASLQAALEALCICDEDQRLHRRAIRIAHALKLINLP